MLFGEGKTSWDLYLKLRNTISQPCLNPHFIGEVGRFGFDPHIYGAEEIYFVL